jgi:hypothetical protein
MYKDPSRLLQPSEYLRFWLAQLAMSPPHMAIERIDENVKLWISYNNQLYDSWIPVLYGFLYSELTPLACAIDISICSRPFQPISWLFLFVADPTPN